MKVWTYVIAVDKGAAPNFEPPEATLTICKPRIRKRARRGELVVAFNGVALNSATPHSVSWAGLVSEVIRFEDYWNDPRFEEKSRAVSASQENHQITFTGLSYRAGLSKSQLSLTSALKWSET